MFKAECLKNDIRLAPSVFFRQSSALEHDVYVQGHYYRNIFGGIPGYRASFTCIKLRYRMNVLWMNSADVLALHVGRLPEYLMVHISELGSTTVVNITSCESDIRLFFSSPAHIMELNEYPNLFYHQVSQGNYQLVIRRTLLQI